MRLTCTLLASFLTFASTAGAADDPHDIEVVGYGGVGFTADLPVQSASGRGNVSFDGAPVYGGLIAYRVQQSGFAYVSYSRQETTGYFRPNGSFEAAGQASITFDYLQFGGNLEAKNGRWTPYLGFSLGAIRLASHDTPGNDWAFSMALEGGLKFEVFDFLQLRLIGKLPVSFANGDSSSLCISSQGCIFAYSGDPLWQGQALLGIGIQL